MDKWDSAKLPKFTTIPEERRGEEEEGVLDTFWQPTVITTIPEQGERGEEERDGMGEKVEWTSIAHTPPLQNQLLTRTDLQY